MSIFSRLNWLELPQSNERDKAIFGRDAQQNANLLVVNQYHLRDGRVVNQLCLSYLNVKVSVNIKWSGPKSIMAGTYIFGVAFKLLARTGNQQVPNNFVDSVQSIKIVVFL